MKPFTRILLGISILCLAACKKEKQFGEKYPNFTGKWECTAAHIIEYRQGHGGVWKPPQSKTEISEINLSGNAYGIHPHILEIKENGKLKVYNHIRLLEQGRISEVIYQNINPLNMDTTIEMYREAILFEVTRNMKQNSFFLSSKEKNVTEKLKHNLFLSYSRLKNNTVVLKLSPEGGLGNFREESEQVGVSVYEKYLNLYYKRI